MPRPDRITWTPAMDAVVRESTIREAMGRLGVSFCAVVKRRVELAAKGQRVRTRGQRSGRPKDGFAKGGPRAGTLAVLRLHGQGFAQAEIGRLRGISQQAVNDIVQKYVVARGWCPTCLKPRPDSPVRCPGCGRARKGG